MARVTAIRKMRNRKKLEVDIDDHIRKLMKCSLEMQIRDYNKENPNRELNLPTKIKAEIIANVVENFGDALFVIAESAVNAELSLYGDDDEDDDRKNKDDDSEEEEDY